VHTPTTCLFHGKVWRLSLWLGFFRLSKLHL
jgi:hypothetical protein